MPETVIVGVEPEDIDTLGIDLTPAMQTKIDPAINMVLAELDRLEVDYKKKVTAQPQIHTDERR